MTATAVRATGADVTADPLWQWLAESSRTTHEAFATYFSVRIDHRYREFLRGNDTYLEYESRAMRLVSGRDLGGADVDRLIDGLLRAAMAPAQLAGWPVDDASALRPADLPDRARPDVRLQLLPAALAGVADRALIDLAAMPASDPTSVAFRDRLAELLGSVGLPTMTTLEHRTWAQRVVSVLNVSGAGRFDLSEGPLDPVASALDDFQRERLQIHDHPLPLRLVDPQTPGWRLDWLTRGHAELGPHVWLVWMRGALLRQQFSPGPEWTVPPDKPTLGFLAIDRTHGEPVARFWLFDQLTPAIVAEGIGRRSGCRVVFLTTLSTIDGTDVVAGLAGIEPAFVLVDQSLSRFLEDVTVQGDRLSWRRLWLNGDREISVLLMARDRLPGVYYLLLASVAGESAFLSWLVRHPDDRVQHDPTLVDSSVADLDALLRHLVGSFWRVDLFGAAPP
jgi:hypothetical protein